LQHSAKLTCLMYHSISGLGSSPRSDDHSQYSLDCRAFERQLTILADSGCVIVPFSDVGSTLIADEVRKSGRPGVALTFDDGNASDMWVAQKLAEHGMTGTFFLVRDRCRSSGEGDLSADQVRELDAMGMTVGTHGCTHRALNRMSETEALGELQDSRKWLEDEVSHEVAVMSFPYGAAGRREIRLASESGYRVIGNSVEAGNRLPVTGCTVNRIAIRRQFSDGIFRRVTALDRFWVLGRRCRAAVLSLPKMFLHRRPFRR
jgi:peptidoglycan/xylan/chitin deacetylase (PgdA/CDA1 family)